MSNNYVPEASQVNYNQKSGTMTFEATYLQVPKTGMCARRINAEFQISGDQPMSKYSELLTEILENMGYKGAEVLEATTSPLVKCNGNTWRMLVHVKSWGKLSDQWKSHAAVVNTEKIANTMLSNADIFRGMTMSEA